MSALLAEYSLSTIIMITATAISWLFMGIRKIVSLYKAAKKAKEDMINEAIQKKEEEEKLDNRIKQEENKIQMLQDTQNKLIEMLENQKKQIELLTVSNQLDIKAWIKQQHDYFMKKGCIDSQSLDLLEKRYAIYTEEGGNGWAAKMVQELRALPSVTLI